MDGYFNHAHLCVLWVLPCSLTHFSVHDPHSLLDKSAHDIRLLVLHLTIHIHPTLHRLKRSITLLSRELCRSVEGGVPGPSPLSL